MRLGHKQTLVQALILLVAVWPAAQYYLCLQYRVSPWKLFGLGMYAVPALPPEISLRGGTPGSLEAISPQEFPGLVRAVVEFGTLRTELGLLAAPTELGCAVFASDRVLRVVEISVADRSLSQSSGLVESAPTLYRYQRDDFEGVNCELGS